MVHDKVCQVLYYDLIFMMDEVCLQTIGFLYYGKEDIEGNTYLVHIYDRSLMIKMLSDPKIEKTVHLYV